jgi:hypothetical protein
VNRRVSFGGRERNVDLSPLRWRTLIHRGDVLKTLDYLIELLFSELGVHRLSAFEAHDELNFIALC